MTKTLLVTTFLLVPSLFCQAQSFADRLQFSGGLGVAQMKRTFTSDNGEWKTHFTYHFGVGYGFNDRFAMGISAYVLVLTGSNASYGAVGSTPVLVTPETKGERFVNAGIFARVIPFAFAKRFAIQADYSAAGYNLVGSKELSGYGYGYSVRASYNVLQNRQVRLEPYFSAGGTALRNKETANYSFHDRSMTQYSIGIQLVLMK